MASGFVSEKQRNQLIQLFTMTLVTLPDQRCSDFGELLQLGQFDRSMNLGFLEGSSDYILGLNPISLWKCTSK